MKAYTDLEQSKKLAEILSLESADMRYGYIAPYEFSDRMYEGGYDDIPYPKDFMKKNPNFSEDEYDGECPCWSLAALLDVLPTIDDRNAVFCKDIRCDKWHVFYHGTATLPLIDIERCHDLVDACYEMIIKLNQQKLL